jgi:hypothetical protein
MCRWCSMTITQAGEELRAWTRQCTWLPDSCGECVNCCMESHRGPPIPPSSVQNVDIDVRCSSLHSTTTLCTGTNGRVLSTTTYVCTDPAYPAYQDCTCHIYSMYSFRDFRYPLFACRRDTLTRKSLGLTNQ